GVRPHFRGLTPIWVGATPDLGVRALSEARGWSNFGGFMLHAALIGFRSSGKSTLFQLMTSAKDAPRGKGDVAIGISKVPDDRLDTLTAMYNPRERVPATVQFTD